MDFDSLRDVKSGLGTAAVMVMDKSTDVIRAIHRLAVFYKHESCGQCTPCREGTGWMMRVMAPHGARPRRGGRDRHAWSRSRARSKATPSAPSAMPPPGRSRGLIRHFRPVMEERIAAYKARQGSMRMAAE